MKTYLAAAAFAALLIAAPAQAQQFTYEVTWGDVEMTGGVGPERSSAAGVVDGNFTANYEDGRTVEGSMHCVGMDQPSGSMFDMHMSCEATSETGTTSIVYGCDWRGEGTNGPLACVGYMEGRGDIEGRAGLLTLDWHSQNASSGTGQWFE
ncbi:hypothetical protein [Erythrobacter alti]|uniref:hypothetical protein n=1 Tax=Erythrobacter alti TaxID=1896145 RepID=UPI0030F3C00A